jgi:hypothetical protein
MMRVKKHIIQKLVVDLEYNGDARGLELENRISRWCRDVLLPYLESILDKEEYEEEITRITRMELEVYLDSREEWPDLLLKKTGIALKEKLDASWFFAEQTYTGKLVNNLVPFDEKLANTVRLHSDDDFLQALLYYLEHASLPWWWDHELPLRNVLEKWLEHTDSDKLQAVKETIKDKQASMRLALLCKSEDLPLLLYLIHTGRRSFVEKLLPLLAKLAACFPADKENEIKVLFETALLEYAICSDREFVINLLQNIHKWFEQVCEEYELQTKAATRIKWKQELFSHIAMTISEIKNLARQSFSRSFSEVEMNILLETAKPFSKKRIKTGVEDPGPGNLFTENLIVDTTGESEESVTEEDQPGDAGDSAIYIINAGAILIAPLLPTLFKRLELVHAGKIINPSLAIMVLHYIVYGNEDASEYDMPLYKILCGIPLKQAVNTSICLENIHKEEAKELLKSVIEYWTVLKDTSVEALRSSFLQRNGKIIRVNKEWKLMVEQKPYDMLLQQLPWSIQMIKLSWMKDLVRTE